MRFIRSEAVKERMLSFTDEQLNKMSTRRLIEISRRLNGIVNYYWHWAGRRCCDICHEYIGNNWQGDVVIPSRPYREMQSKVDKIISSRPDEDFEVSTKPSHRKMEFSRTDKKKRPISWNK